MTLLYHLLRDGYFPKELPPAFNTVSFADLMVSDKTSLRPDFKNNLKSSLNAKETEHSLARVGKLKRKLSIPNPITYFFLCEEIEKNWSELRRQAFSSQLSKSKPIPPINSFRALSPNHPPNEIPLLRARYRMGSKYILTTDVRDFYHSIYTHSISWALHTKSIAKEMKKSGELLGNSLDYLIRNCQDLQTTGIPVGPDTSFLLSEILLSSIDAIIIKKFHKMTNSDLKGFRWMDDYELCFSNLHEAEIGLNCIEFALSQFELGLNSGKTRIRKLPIALEEHWSRELKTFEIRDNEKAQLNDIISYFSRAFELAEEYPEKSVLKYAVNRLRSTIDNREVKQSVWPLLRELMLECIINEPGTIDYVLNFLVKSFNNGYEMDTIQLEGVLNSQIINHAPLGHDSEVAWSIWGSILFGLQLYPKTAQIISQMDDSVVALLALDAESQGYFQEPLERDVWSQYMDKQGLYGEQWLLSYEANIKKWIPASGRDHVNADSRFNYLKKNGIQFYDASLAAKKITYESIPTQGSYYNLSD
jgi:hypothetical protein